jgi:peptidyl-prolyl cis-trans isomerase A (cyclophilin A)
MTEAVGKAVGRDIDVRIVTPLGGITVRVFPARAPVTAGDFLEHVAAKLYEGATFYRAVRHDNDSNPCKITVLQGGVMDMSASFGGLVHESTFVTGLRHVDGAVSAARLEPGSGTSASFFICVGDQSELDFGGFRHPDGQGYAVFGQVTEGMDIVRKIHALPTVAQAPHPVILGQLLANPVQFLSVVRVAV